MKKRIIWILVSCAALIPVMLFFSWEKKVYSAPVPEPSAWGGYYENEFTLELKAPPNGRIYYTTDGSLPTPESNLYQDGIPLTDRSGEPNHYNSIQNVVPDWKDYQPDMTPVPKGTVIRAIFVNDQDIQSEVLTQTYFIGIEPPERGYTLSLIFEEADLFGDDGIYVTGREYDDWYLSEKREEPAPQANFQKRTEAAAVAELMTPSGDILNQPLGLRLQGNSARGWEKKRFILEAKSEYSGTEFLEAPLFDGVMPHSVMVKEALPDALAADLLPDRRVGIQQSIPVRLYLNGEFWQDTYLLERYDKQYFRQYYQVENRMLVKNGMTDEDSAALNDLDYYAEFMDWVEHTDFSDPNQWAQLQKEMDVQSYIDYIAANYFLCNYDFSPYQNYVTWRPPAYLDPETADTRWRWCLYDIDAVSTVEFAIPTMLFPTDVTHPAQVNVFTSVFPQTVVRVTDSLPYRSLRNSPEFNRQFVLSFMDLLNNNFAPANVEKVLAKYGETLDWKDGYFRLRPEYAVQHLREEFDLKGTLETVTITTADPRMGSVRVNTSAIDLSSGSWSGQYFTDYPITVTAEAAAGYRFVGWKGDKTASSLTLPVDGGLHLEAVFAEK